MIRKIVIFAAIIIVLCLLLIGRSMVSHATILKPNRFTSDVKHLKKSNLVQRETEFWSGSRCNTSSGIIDTLTWRKKGASEVVNVGFLNPGDSALVWLKPAGACSLIAIRFKPWNWEGNMLLDIWDGSRYSPHIYSPDSTDEQGWCPLGTEIGPYYTIQCISPLGWNYRDTEHRYWGPHPYTITGAHSDAWIEIPAEIGIQGQVDLGSGAFYIGTNFFITQGWGFYAQQAYPGSTPYNFFKYYSAGVGPDGVHDGWFLRSYQLWFEAIVKYYENTPPEIENVTIQNYTYAPGPFPVSAYITDQDAENSVNAGVARAYLVYTMNTVTDSTRMNGPCNGGIFSGTIPSISKNDTVSYYISAYDPHKLHSKSMKVTFARLEPENPGADILVVWDDMRNSDLDTFFVDLFSLLKTPFNDHYVYELWNISKRNGIDESVINWGWHTIYISGWMCQNTLPGRDYESNPFVAWLEAGTIEAPHNLLYSDQGYCCAHPEYDCGFQGELSPGDFLYDYFGVAFLLCDGGKIFEWFPDSVAFGQQGTEFEGIRVNFLPDVMYPNNPENRLWTDWLVELTEDAEQIFEYKDSGFGAGVRLDRGHYKTIYLPWPDFFAVDSSENGDLVPRSELTTTIERILLWFGPPHDPPIVGIEPNENETNVPKRYYLQQNYPNPFNSETKIGFQLAEDCWVELSIYNLLGQHIRTLFEGEQPAGSYSVMWNGKDDLGEAAGSGIYFYQMKAGDLVKTKRMLLLK